LSAPLPVFILDFNLLVAKFPSLFKGKKIGIQFF